MKIKHKGIRMFKKVCRMMSLAMLMPSFLLAAPDYKQKFTQILDFISNDFIKAIGSLIVVGTCIYAYKNWDRLGEIGWKCVGIIIITTAISNAKTLSQWLF
ncbi:virB2 type IV secretion protein [Helicobacter pylori]|uniref:virB2 type IV secretion protein n=1 Tax=Helicobacter pylori TaxID=210 RepID=UPI000EB0F5F7|nr:virB2 type IV secretion protein [Helicobacter pylori]RKV21734.1 virB2 type IV secretion protein [Helicobacter pylori]